MTGSVPLCCKALCAEASAAGRGPVLLISSIKLAHRAGGRGVVGDNSVKIFDLDHAEKRARLTPEGQAFLTENAQKVGREMMEDFQISETAAAVVVWATLVSTIKRSKANLELMEFGEVHPSTYGDD